MAVTISRTAWTDDDGTGTTGTVINNAVKTELYNQIDALIAALLGAANAFTATQSTSASWKAGAAASYQTTLDGSSLNAKNNGVNSTLYLNDSGGPLHLGGAVTLAGHLSGTPSFAAGDKYLVVNASGAIHVSAIGPAS